MAASSAESARPIPANRDRPIAADRETVIPANRDRVTSPNQDSKRRQIIEAARVVLARDGLAGCTARAVADASPLTKSAIHYYFRDIDEIVDQAVGAHVEAMLAGLREVAARHSDPGQRLRAVVRAYLDTFADKPYAAFLWFEYWIAAGRREATGPTERMLADVHALLAGLLADLPGASEVPERPDRPGASGERAGASGERAGGAGEAAHALLSWLLGTIVQQHVRPRPAAEIQAELSRFLAPPSAP